MTDQENIDIVHLVNAIGHALLFVGMGIYMIYRYITTKHVRDPTKKQYDDRDANFLSFDTICWVAFILGGVAMFINFAMYLDLGWVERVYDCLASPITSGRIYWAEWIEKAISFILYSLMTMFYLNVRPGWIQMMMALTVFTSFMGLGVSLTCALSPHLLFGIMGAIMLVIVAILMFVKGVVPTAYGWIAALVWVVLAALYGIFMGFSWEASIGIEPFYSNRWQTSLCYLIFDVVRHIGGTIYLLATFSSRMGAGKPEILKI